MILGDPESPHAGLLRELGIVGEGAEGLARYLDMLAAWSERVNLSGARTPTERVATLVAPVAAVARDVAPGTVLDVGSGNGSPGIVLAALRPDLAVTLLEPRMKRWAFLREAARRVGRPDVEVRRDRFEEYAGPRVRTLTVRALRLPPHNAARLLEPGGEWWVFGKRPGSDDAFVPAPRQVGWPDGVHRFLRRGTS